MDTAIDENQATYLGMMTTDIDPLWNLTEDFTVQDAASLIAGYSPEVIESCINDTAFDQNFSSYLVAFKALTNAVTNDRLKVSVRFSAREFGYADKISDIDYWEALHINVSGSTAEDDEILSKDHSCFYKAFPDWKLTTVSRTDLVTWLRSRGIHTGFFFPNEQDKPNYLDPEHPRYAPKLSAAINAWLTLESEADLKGKTPKQALSKWLREHAAVYNLSDDEGKPNETGIEECSKVANWREKGGAPSTPIR